MIFSRLEKVVLMVCLGMWWGFAIAQVGLKSYDPHVLASGVLAL